MKSGFLLIDKPKGITSHDVIYYLRKITGIKRIGHGGTLDPNATGLLIVGVGREYTKKLGEITKNTNKEYIGKIVLGETSDTDDGEGCVLRTRETIVVNYDDIKRVILNFKGEIEQVPPSFSAIRINGKKAYQLARKGKQVQMKPRKVVIYSIQVLQYKYPNLRIKCEVSSGTYIRALARDIGAKLKTGAYLADLRRIKIGEYDIKAAVELDQLSADNWESYLK